MTLVSAYWQVGDLHHSCRSMPTWRRSPTCERFFKRPLLRIPQILKDKSMQYALSGDGSSIFFRSEGRLYSHIMNPRTGFPAEGMVSTSVITPKTIDSEAWAKPYYILGPYWTAQHKQKDFRVFFCEDKPGTRCEWLQ